MPRPPTSTARKARYVPFRILYVCMYGQLPWLTRSPDGRVSVRTSLLSRRLRLSVQRTKDSLRWLRDVGAIVDLREEPGLWSFTVRLWPEAESGLPARQAVGRL